MPEIVLELSKGLVLECMRSLAFSFREAKTTTSDKRNSHDSFKVEGRMYLLQDFN